MFRLLFRKWTKTLDVIPIGITIAPFEKITQFDQLSLNFNHYIFFSSLFCQTKHKNCLPESLSSNCRWVLMIIELFLKIKNDAAMPIFEEIWLKLKLHRHATKNQKLERILFYGSSLTMNQGWFNGWLCMIKDEYLRTPLYGQPGYFFKYAVLYLNKCFLRTMKQLSARWYVFFSFITSNKITWFLSQV